MKIYFGIILLYLLIKLNAVHLSPISIQESEKTPWNIDEFLTGTSGVKKFRGTWISDNEYIFAQPTLKGTEYKKYNVISDSTSTFVSADQLKNYKNADYSLSPDNKKFLIAYEKEKVFRHSSRAKYDVLEIETGKIHKIADGKLLQHVKFAPSSDRVAYVQLNNIYAYKLTGESYQITKDGDVGRIYNGVPDWVYEEEVFSADSAIWWSPDGEKLAFAHFIDDDVQIFKYFIYGEPNSLDSQYPQEIDIRYPKPGTPNPNVSLYVADLKNIGVENAIKLTKLKTPINTVSKDNVLNAVSWSSNEKVVALWQNRRQNVGVLIEYESTSGDSRAVRKISEPKGWLMTMELNCNPDKNTENTCSMIDWIGNWMQIWEMDLKTGENLKPQSFGNFTVTKIHGKRNGDWLYEATSAEYPSEMHVYKNETCLSCDVLDSEGEKCTAANAYFSKDFGHMVLSCNGPNPAIIRIHDTDTMKELKVLQTNEDYRKKVLAKKIMPQIKYIKTKVEGGYDAIIKLYLPPGLNWDKPDPKKKYPLIVYVYSGPNSSKIKNDFAIGWDSYLVTTRNVIYAEIEGRGTGHKGKDILYVINNNLGTVEIDDQIAVTSYLQNTYSFIDRDRTAIWGWSYGGYATAKVIAKDDKRIFQCGVSVAPVTQWTYYDTIYTERYMGLPSWDDNLRGYEKGGLLTGDPKTITNFKNHDFLLMHGVADDNVHFQQSLQLSKILQKNNVIFEEMLYPDEDHGIVKLRSHLYRNMDQFLVNCLNLETNDE